MKFIVCIKQVPEASELRFDNEKKTLIREGVPNQISTFDRRAITFAEEIRKKFGGEVLVITMGPPQAKERGGLKNIKPNMRRIVFQCR